MKWGLQPVAVARRVSSNPVPASSRLALVPSAKKMGGPGTPIDVPLGHKDAAYVRSHFDAMEVRLNDSPRADEILVAVVLAIGGRPLHRTKPVA